MIFILIYVGLVYVWTRLTYIDKVYPTAPPSGGSISDNVC